MRQMLCYKKLLAVSVSFLAITAAGNSTAADEQSKTPRRIVPDTFVQTDMATLKVLVEALQPQAKELGCEVVSKAPSHPAMGKHGTSQGKGGGGHGMMKRHGMPHGLPESVFFACGSPETAQKFVAAAQEIAGRTLESRPEALIQVGFALAKPTAALTNCPVTCQTSTGPKPGFLLSGHCFVCQ